MILKEKAIHGVRWNAIGAIVTSLVKFVQVCILARFLSKSDMGVLSIALVFISLCDLFSDMGITSAVLHKQKITNKQYSSLFYFNLLVSFIVSVLLCVSSPFVASFYDQGELINIIQLLSINAFFIGASRLQRTFLQKQLLFKSLTIIDLIGVIISLLLLVIFINLDYGIYSLVYTNILSSCFIGIILYFYCRKRLKILFYFNYKDIKSFIKIGIYQLGASFLDFTSREIDIMIIARVYPLEIVGGYSLCKQLVLKLYGTINPIVSKVLTPLLATIQNDSLCLKDTYLKIIRLLSFCNYPLYLCIATLSYPLINIIYGSSYVEFYLILSIIAVTYSFLSVSSPVGNLEIALGRTDLGFYWTIYRIISTGIILYLFSNATIIIMLLGMLGLTIINIGLISRFLIYKMIPIKVFDYFKIQFIPFIISLIIGIPVFMFSYIGNPIIYLLVFSTVYMISYLHISYLLNSNYVEIVSLLKSIVLKNG